jgi:dephospho-CoA kinase
MKIIGLTGGIGSGKSTLLNHLKAKGIPCFESDKVGKELLNGQLRQAVIDTFGPQLYNKGILDRAALAQLVFQNQEALERLNKLVHPAVAEAFTDFIAKNNTAPLLVKEAAILFETEGYKSCDDVILVCAPKEERILRVIQRDGVGRAEVEARMAKQWEDAKKRPLADFVIENDNLASAKQQLDSILNQLLPQQKD